MVKPATIRIVLCIALSNNWNIQQHDINNIFLNGVFKEEVFMTQPLSFVDRYQLADVCHLNKAIYILKQAL